MKAYRFPLFLIAAIIIGSILGILLGERAEVLKPLGDIFLNLMFTIVVPLVFFSISAVIANMSNLKRLGTIMTWMMIVFIVTGIISSIVMIAAVTLSPPAAGVSIQFETPEEIDESLSLGAQIVQAVTVPDFVDIFSRTSMLALIIMSVLVGFATNLAGSEGRIFAQFLNSGAQVMRKLVGIIMYYAPIGLGAYFASLVGVFGPELLGSYAKAMIVYYPVAILYFLIGFTLYAFIAGGKSGVKVFWKNILTPAVTALSTGSSVATIPANLQATEKMGVHKDVRDVVIPLGASIHMDGSALAAILKIAFLFGIFQMDFLSFQTFAIAIGISLLVGTVMSGVPGGGFIGEMLIITMYGFPMEALPILAILGTLVDPPATMVNASGDAVSSMLVSRAVEGDEWMDEAERPAS
ncbi:H(+):sodium-glutamate symporter [Alkalihalophilus pseudofirmus OF4]|uniref:H(+):sodium-glutamate symporter n=1 Tax=Alkalihalophilus pseudofirmus (strain ATCC BAA-2126 / JCM 17055 / OF4) TaxID=398511 RepID=D3FY77_ALKPO|nr:dicarboxylate/amino acid:cation symporter [Alkalihalophilus pseudofirmus]ADC49100.1 H(+):sodium-glutamate symporter [Alkalihalophilus pseudofirmus OF4]